MNLKQGALVYPFEPVSAHPGCGPAVKNPPGSKFAVLCVGIELATFQSKVPHSDLWRTGVHCVTTHCGSKRAYIHPSDFCVLDFHPTSCAKSHCAGDIIVKFFTQLMHASTFLHRCMADHSWNQLSLSLTYSLQVSYQLGVQTWRLWLISSHAMSNFPYWCHGGSSRTIDDSGDMYRKMTPPPIMGQISKTISCEVKKLPGARYV